MDKHEAESWPNHTVCVPGFKRTCSRNRITQDDDRLQLFPPTGDWKYHSGLIWLNCDRRCRVDGAASEMMNASRGLEYLLLTHLDAPSTALPS